MSWIEIDLSDSHFALPTQVVSFLHMGRLNMILTELIRVQFSMVD